MPEAIRKDFIGIRVISPAKKSSTEKTVGNAASNTMNANAAANAHMPYSEIYGNFMSFLVFPTAYDANLVTSDRVKHANLCSYLDIVRGKQNRLFILAESYDKSLSLRDYAKSIPNVCSFKNLKFVIWQIFDALRYIHGHPHLKLHGNICPDTIFVLETGLVKLSNYGLYAMTNEGKQVDFPFGVLPFVDPEYVKRGSLTAKSDLFSLGLSILDVVVPFTPKLQHDSSSSCSFSCSNSALLSMLAQWDFDKPNSLVACIKESLEMLKDLNGDLYSLIHGLLFFPGDEVDDATFEYFMLGFPFLQGASEAVSEIIRKAPASSGIFNSREEFLKVKLPQGFIDNPLLHIPLDVLCLFWRVAGGDVESEWNQNQSKLYRRHQTLSPCILIMPKIVSSLPYDEIGADIDVGHLYSDREIHVSLNRLLNRVTTGLATNQPKDQTCSSSKSSLKENTSTDGSDEVDCDINFLPLYDIQSSLGDEDPEDVNGDTATSLEKSMIHTASQSSLVVPGKGNMSRSASRESLAVYSRSPKHDRNIRSYLKKFMKLPSRVREHDIDYQYHRILLFQRLLEAFPHSKQEILSEALIDIPPFYKGIVWAVILDVFRDEPGFILRHKISYSKELDDTLTGRQIDVDVPRCHQYHPLLSSPQGHEKLKIILKSWVANNPDLAYWQGLDSVAALFVVVNFASSDIAYACLQEFVNKHLRNLYRSDNSGVLHEFLAILEHLIVFHDPVLGSHFHDISFHPNLYAIPWLLTLFTHVFPMDKIFNFWDKVLVGPVGLGFFMALSIVLSFRQRLLEADFNDCILMFTDLPEIDIESCQKNAIKLMQVTPPSIYAIETEEITSSKRTTEKISRISYVDLCVVLPQCYVIDTRSESLFLQCHLVKSDHWDEANPIEHYISKANSHSYLIVIGSDPLKQQQVATRLVLEGKIKRVSVLQGSFPPTMTDWSFFEQICYCQCPNQNRKPMACQGTPDINK